MESSHNSSEEHHQTELSSGIWNAVDLTSTEEEAIVQQVLANLLEAQRTLQAI